MVLQGHKEFPQPGFVLRQRLIKKTFAGAVQRGGMVFALADIESAINVESLIHIGAPLHHYMAAVTTPEAGTHVTKRPGPVGPALSLSAVNKCLRTRRQHPPDHQ
jgi:hypothetical protein